MSRYLFNRKNGMTLVEVVVAFVLLGILIVGFLSIFTSGFTFIARAGNQTKLSYEAQAQIEVDKANLVETGLDALSFTFPSAPTVTVNGTVVEVELIENGNSIKVHSFVPEE